MEKKTFIILGTIQELVFHVIELSGTIQFVRCNISWNIRRGNALVFQFINVCSNIILQEHSF